MHGAEIFFYVVWVQNAATCVDGGNTWGGFTFGSYFTMFNIFGIMKAAGVVKDIFGKTPDSF